MPLLSPLHHPAQGQIKLAPSQWGTGTVWKGFSFLFPSLDLPGSSCLSRLPALRPPDDACGRTQQIGHTWGWGPYSTSIFDPTVCVLCSASSSDRWL